MVSVCPIMGQYRLGWHATFQSGTPPFRSSDGSVCPVLAAPGAWSGRSASPWVSTRPARCSAGVSDARRHRPRTGGRLRADHRPADGDRAALRTDLDSVCPHRAVDSRQRSATLGIGTVRQCLGRCGKRPVPQRRCWKAGDLQPGRTHTDRSAARWASRAPTGLRAATPIPRTRLSARDTVNRPMPHRVHTRPARPEREPAVAITTDADVVGTFLEDAAHFPGGHAPGVAHPRSEGDVAALVRKIHPLLPVGAQSSLTGGAMPMGETVVATDHLDRVLAVSRARSDHGASRRVFRAGS